MKETIEDISSDIELQYGKKNMDGNIAYVLSLLEARMKDGVLDDNIPVPSQEAAAKTILLLLDRPELSWETICRENRVRNVMEYFLSGHTTTMARCRILSAGYCGTMSRAYLPKQSLRS